MTATMIDEAQPRSQAALANSPVYELRDLQVEQHDGTLQISGRVSSFYHKQLAQEVVRSVSKGIEVVNLLQVEPDGIGL
jgi:osmotically-inducible protein OsmY